MAHTSLGHRAPLIWLLTPFVLGLLLGKLSPSAVPLVPVLVGAVASAGIALAAARRPSAICAVFLYVSLISSGAAYYELRRVRIPAWDELPPREVQLTVQLRRIFAGSFAPDRFSGIATIESAPAHLRDLVGQEVSVSANLRIRDPRPIRGMTLTLVGMLEVLPRRPVADDFTTYLIDSGINFRVSRARLIAPAPHVGRYAAARERFRLQAIDWLSTGLDRHPEAAKTLQGMLLGARQSLPPEQEDLYLRSGTMHLFAISGLHIGVIATAIIAVLGLCRIPRVATFAINAVILWGYVDLTGALPSAVRAWVMVVCLHAALVVRAPGNLMAALVATAGIVLLVDPMQLFGAGFQMSYSIVAAILLYGVPLHERWSQLVPLWRHIPPAALSRWQRVAQYVWRALQSSLSVGVAASLIGTISGVAFFEIFAPGSLLANLPLIPLATLVILAGFLTLVFGCLGLPSLTILFNYAGALLLRFMEELLQAMVELPGFSAPANFRSASAGSLALLLVLATMMWGYATQWDQRRGGFWLPIVAATGALAAGMQFQL